MEDDPTAPCWDYSDVAAYAKLSVRTVKSYKAHKGLPHVDIDGTIRFRPVEVRRWFADRNRNGGDAK